nr:hypothetical protein BaRGS_023525 [Batillaria attramentaria]
MQYRMGGLPAMATHQPSSGSGSGSDADRGPCHIPVSAPNGAPMRNFLPRPPPSADMFDPAVRVKQEPMEEEEEEEERGMVIDLTPRGPIPMGGTASDGGGGGGGGGVVNGGGGAGGGGGGGGGRGSTTDINNRHHPYNQAVRAPPPHPYTTTQRHKHHQAQKDAWGFRGENISTDSDSGSETNSNASSIRSGSGSSGSNGDGSGMVSGTFRFSIPKTSLGAIGSATQSRAKREFVPEGKKDASYWNKRIKNNDSARRSRIKRKTMEKLMEHRMVELQQENMELRYELNALKRMFGEQLGADYHSKFPNDTRPPSSTSTPLPGSGMTKPSSSSSSSNHSTSSSPLGGSDEDVHGKRASHDDRAPPSHSHSRKPPSRSSHSNCLDLSPKTLTSESLRHYARSSSISSMMSDASSGATSAVPASESCTEASPCSSSSPQGSPGSMSGPQTSEEEGGSSAGGGRRGSVADDESLQKIPWKCRMKRGLHSVFATNQNSSAAEDMK